MSYKYFANFLKRGNKKRDSHKDNDLSDKEDYR